MISMRSHNQGPYSPIIIYSNTMGISRPSVASNKLVLATCQVHYMDLTTGGIWVAFDYPIYRFALRYVVQRGHDLRVSRDVASCKEAFASR